MKEFKIGCALVRIHGEADQEKIRTATEIFAKKVVKCRKAKSKKQS